MSALFVALPKWSRTPDVVKTVRNDSSVRSGVLVLMEVKGEGWETEVRSRSRSLR